MRPTLLAPASMGDPGDAPCVVGFARFVRFKTLYTSHRNCRLLRSAIWKRLSRTVGREKIRASQRVASGIAEQEWAGDPVGRWIEPTIAALASGHVIRVYTGDAIRTKIGRWNIGVDGGRIDQSWRKRQAALHRGDPGELPATDEVIGLDF